MRVGLTTLSAARTAPSLSRATAPPRQKTLPQGRSNTRIQKSARLKVGARAKEVEEHLVDVGRQLQVQQHAPGIALGPLRLLGHAHGVTIGPDPGAARGRPGAALWGRARFSREQMPSETHASSDQQAARADRCDRRAWQPAQSLSSARRRRRASSRAQRDVWRKTTRKNSGDRAPKRRARHARSRIRAKESVGEISHSITNTRTHHHGGARELLQARHAARQGACVHRAPLLRPPTSRRARVRWPSGVCTRAATARRAPLPNNRRRSRW